MSRVYKGFQALMKFKEHKTYKAIAELHESNMLYRKEGLVYDDLIPEEGPLVQEALRRLSPQEAAKRLFRMRRALNINLKKLQLPVEEHITAQTDYRYLSPIISQIEAEIMTRHEFENMSAIPSNLINRNKSS